MKYRFTKSNFIIIAAAVVTISLCFLVALRSHEKRYLGKPISDWVRQDMRDRSRRPQVMEALNQFPEDTIKAIVQVMRDHIQETKYQRWLNSSTSYSAKILRKHLPRSIGAWDARMYFRYMAQTALTGKSLTTPGFPPFQISANPRVPAAWITVILAMLKDANALIRTEAIVVFSSQEEFDIQDWDQKNGIMAAFVDARQDSDGQVRWEAVKALAKLRPITETAVKALVKACDEQDLRRGAALALSKIKREATVAVPILIDEGLHDLSPSVRASFLGAVGNYGPAAAFALPQLLLALNDRDEEVLAEVKRALLLIKGKPGLEQP